MPAALRTRPAVPIAKVGTWLTATGQWDCTAEQLRDAVLAQHDPSFRAGVLKLGHTDPRFTDGTLLGDGEPAVGRLENLRLAADGQTLLADLVGIPAWLDDVLDTAYPSRSIECMTGVQTTDGARYAMVVTGLSLLGATRPAIESLGDLADLFGVSTDVEAYTAAARVAAALPVEGDPVAVRQLGQVVASASIEELTSAFERWAEDQPTIGPDAYVRDVYTDSLIAVVWRPGGDSLLYRCTWTETADAVFTFGAPERVRQTYVPVEDSTQVTAASGTLPIDTDVMWRRYHQHPSQAVRSPRGRDVTAGEHPKENNVPISPAVAEALGLGEDADDAAVLAALDKLRTQPAPAPQAEQGSGTPATPPAVAVPDSPADLDALVAARVSAAVGPAIQSAVAPVIARLGEATDALAAIRKADADKAKTDVITAALADGKILPAHREQWEADYDANPQVITAALSRIAVGSAVPVTAMGSNTISDADASLFASLFGGSAALKVGGDV